MSNIINYTIKFFSDWHVGSGLDAGRNADALVIKTKNNLPMIPGKTIKGLFRDALMDLADIGRIEEDEIIEIFGSKSDAKTTQEGSAFFSNATLPTAEVLAINANQLAPFLYRNLASTRINKSGVAETGSLRSIEVCIPLQLEGYITLKNEGTSSKLEKAAKFIRYLGVQRNRGLGRCQFIIHKKPNAI